MSPQKPERHTSHMVVPHDDPKLESLQDVFDEHLVLIKATAEALKALVTDQEWCRAAIAAHEEYLQTLQREQAEIRQEARDLAEEVGTKIGQINATLEGMEKRANFFEDRLRNLEGKP